MNWKVFPRMSWYDFAFEEYKRSRNAVFSNSLRNLRCPHDPGLVSIILPVFNGAAMVSEAIDSILIQTYQDFELICVDDGSTDGSAAILDRYAECDARVRVIHQENLKLPRSLSRGFALARGEYRTWTSHDNRWKPDYLEKMVTCLLRHPDWDMIYANPDIIDEQGNQLIGSKWYATIQHPPGSGHVFLPPNTGRLNTLPDNYVGAAFMYRDRVTYLLGDYAHTRYTLEDYDYWMQVNSLLNLRHAGFPDQVYEYRFHSTSLTARDDELGITRSRGKLFVFDSFRRDFYLSPLVWIIDQNAVSPDHTPKFQALHRQIQKQGDILISRECLSVQYPSLWMPCVYLYSTSLAEDHSPLPSSSVPNAMRVLLAITDDPLPDNVVDGWDCCINLGESKDLPKLPGHYRGWLQTQDIPTLITTVDIVTRTTHVRSIEEEIGKQVRPKNKISVVVSTYRRPGQLNTALESLATQSMPNSDYEVIVVNNDPADEETNQIVEAARKQYFLGNPEKLRLIVCPIPGLSSARNAGIGMATGELVGFFDDDAIASHDWLEKIWLAYAGHPTVGVIGGAIILQPPDPRPKALKPGLEPLWGHFIPDFQHFHIAEHWFEYPWGSNWFAPRQLMLEIGGFRSQYGRRKQDFGGGEEVVAAALIRSLGYEIAIEPSAIIYHNPSPDRYTLKHAWKSTIQGTLVSYRIQKHLYLPLVELIPGNVKQIIRVCVWFVSNLLPWRWKPGLAYFYFIKLVSRLVLMVEQIRDYLYRFKKPDLLDG